MTPLSRIVFAAAMGATAFAYSPIVQAAMPGAQGTFAGEDRHISMGNVRIERVDGRMSLILDDDFSLDSAPGARVVLSRPNGTSVDLGALRAEMGGQVYAIPGGLSLSVFDRVVIRSGDATIQLASASLS
ncbi:MAG: hypothetical protein AAF264_04410 [Pseudomonadota bacterium]